MYVIMINLKGCLCEKVDELTCSYASAMEYETIVITVSPLIYCSWMDKRLETHMLPFLHIT